jgi:predicted GNAT family N-acyltransferase
LSYVIEALNERHDRRAFDCGVESLTRYLQTQASQDIRRNVATVRVATPVAYVAAGSEIAGYYSLANTGISREILPDASRRGMPRYPVLPAILLGRLAVDIHHRKRKLGAWLLSDALSFSLASPIAWTLMVTDAIDESARSFYEHSGFRALKDNAHHLYIARQEIVLIMESESRGHGF